MSHYADTRYRSRQERDSRTAGYVEDAYVESRGGHGNRQMELAYHHDDSDGSIEEVTRDYPPGEYGYGYGYPRRGKVTAVREGLRRTRSVGARDPYHESGYYRSDDHRRSNRYRDKHDRYVRRSSYSSSRSPSPPRRRKSLSEQALGALGLGGMLGSSSGKHQGRGRSHGKDGHRRNRSYSYSSSRSRDGRRPAKTEERIGHAVKAALTAGAAAAYQESKSPGGWTGEKGKRVLTAAISAGGVDGFRDPDKKKKGGVIGSVLTGLATNRLVHGPRDKSRSRSRPGRRDRSQSRGGFKDLAATGILAAAGKEVYDGFRSKSRGRDQSSYDSDSPSRRHSKKKRSHSVSAYVNKGLAALGLDEGARESGGGRRRQGKSSRYSDESDDESDDDRYRSRRHGGSSRDVGRFRSQVDSPNTSLTSYRAPGLSAGDPDGAGSHGSKSDSDSDLGSSSEDNRKGKKILRSEMLTTGLAAVATIHAAHNIAKGVGRRKKRHQQGEITPEEARKRKIKSNVMDAASVGIAALGIREAVSEWKEAHELRNEHKHFKEEAKERAQKRAQRRGRSQSVSYSSRKPLSNDSDDRDDDNMSEYSDDRS